MTLVIDSKVFAVAGGGGRTPSGHNSIYQKILRANIILSIDHKNRISIIKNRYEKPKKDLDKNETIEILTDVLCRYLYNNCMNMFQEGMKIQLKDAIEKTLKGGEINDNNFIRRESKIDGVDPSRTQGTV